MINVTVWNENIEQNTSEVSKVNRGGMHKTLEKFISKDENIVDRVIKTVHKGVEFILLHSSHFSKLFVQLMGTTCKLKWREV